VTDQAIVPFTCETCGSRFAARGGGRCANCGKIACHEHLRWRQAPASFVCRACDGESATTKKG
jgi:hypothetical protein